MSANACRPFVLRWQYAMESGSEYYTTAEVAMSLGVSRQRVSQLLKSGELKGEKIAETGRWRIPEDTLDEYLRSRGGLKTRRRRLEDHPRFRELEEEVRDFRKCLARFEVRLGILEGLLEDQRATLLRLMYEKEGDGGASNARGRT